MEPNQHSREQASAHGRRELRLDTPGCSDRVQLRAGAINVSVSVADYARWDLAGRGLDSVVRASVHYYNTDEELDRLCEALPPPAVRQ